MAFGFKGKVKEIVTSMDAIRQHADAPRDITLREYLAKNFKDDGKAATPGHLLAENGIDPQSTKVKDLMSNEDTAYLLPVLVHDGVRQGIGIAQRELMKRAREHNIANLGPITADGGAQRFMSPDIFLDAVDRSIVENTYYPDLIIREEPVSGLTVTVPRIDLSDAGLKDSGEGATIETGTVTYGSKQVELAKKARGIEVTYESIMFNSISLASLWFRDVGRRLGSTLNGMAVDTIVDGDQGDGSEAAAVIGVDDTSAGITWKDLARVAIRGGLIGRNYSQAVGDETVTLDFIDLDEMKRLFFGAPLLGTRLKTPLNMPDSLYASVRTPAHQLVLNDPSASLVQLTAMPLMVETDKIVKKQIEGTYVSIYTGFAKLMRTASVIIDGSIAYAGHEFPTWMAASTTD